MRALTKHRIIHSLITARRRTRRQSVAPTALLAALAAVLGCVLAVPPAVAAPQPGGARLVSMRPLGGRQFDLTVYSPAMNRTVSLWVSHPPGGPAPTLYLLNAVDGGETGGAWTARTDVANFFADKHVNVVVPMGGRASFYTDWERDDPILGRNKWETFLNRELPPLIDATLHATGRDGIAGESMSATSALDLAIHAPGHYQAVGSYSGCAQTSDPAARALVTSEVALFGANAANMWGPPSDGSWADHDPTLHADRLRGARLYIASGTGAPGPEDTLSAPGINGNPAALIDRVVVGGTMESVVLGCTRTLVDRLHALGIPVIADMAPTGTHAWPYWQDDLHKSWPMFAAALGA